MYKVRQSHLSQNFLINRELVQKLVRDSSIVSTDIVIDIGAGTGIITQELLKITSHVVPIEKDPRLTNHPQDFLTYTLPQKPFKVFANIPFNISAEIIKKLLADDFLTEANLVVQKETAEKFMAGSMQATLAYPWWNMTIVYRFKRSDFRPIPRVDSVLLKITRRNIPLVKQKSVYQDFVAYHFGRSPLFKLIPAERWTQTYEAKPEIRGAFAKLLREQDLIPKIHRTRNDNNLKRF